MSLLLNRDQIPQDPIDEHNRSVILNRDQISQDLIDEHNRFSTSGSRCIQFEIQAALIPDQNKFEYQSPQELARTVEGFVDSESAEEYSVYFHGISDAEIEVIESELRAFDMMSMVRFTFEKALDASILRIRPGEAHHMIASTFSREFAHKMASIPGHSKHSVTSCGATIFRIPGVRSKEGDQSFRPRTRRGAGKWPSVMVQVGYSREMNFLRLDAEWWLLHSEGRIRFVILFRMERDPFALHIECWMMAETGYRQTRHTPDKVPRCVQEFDIDAAGDVTSTTKSTKLEIPYDAIFDVRDPDSPPPATTSFSFTELSGYALRLFHDQA